MAIIFMAGSTGQLLAIVPFAPHDHEPTEFGIQYMIYAVLFALVVAVVAVLMLRLRKLNAAHDKTRQNLGKAGSMGKLGLHTSIEEYKERLAAEINASEAQDAGRELVDNTYMDATDLQNEDFVFAM